MIKLNIKNKKKHKTANLNNINIKRKRGKQKIKTVIIDFTHSFRNNINFKSYKFKMKKIYNYVKEYLEKSIVIREKSYYINPKNKFLIIYKIVVLCCLIISILIYSTLLGIYNEINYSHGINEFFYCLSIVLIFDIFINFFVAFYRKNILIKNVRDISKNYLMTWFFFDIFFIFPFSFFNNIKNKNIIFLFKLSRILRFIKIFQLKKIIISIFSKYLKRGYDRIFFYIINLLLIIHSIACIFLVIGNYNTVDSWVIRNNLTNNTDKYITSIYWSFYTVFQVGYGDIKVKNKLEYTFSIIVNFYSIISNSIIISTILNILFSYLINIKRKQKIHSMLYKFKNKNIDKFFLKKIQNYLDHKFIENRNLIELKKKLPIKLKFEINCELIKFKLSKIKFFNTKTESFKFYISQFLEGIEYITGDYIFKKYDNSEYFYFIYKGCITLYTTNDNKTQEKIVSFKNGEFFGDYEIFDNSKRWFFAKSTTSSYLYKFNKIYFEEIFLNKFPNYGKSLLECSNKNKTKIIKKLKSIDNFKDYVKKKIETRRKRNKTCINFKVLKKKLNFKDIFQKLDKIVKNTNQINSICFRNNNKPIYERKATRVLSKTNQYENYINLNL